MQARPHPTGDRYHAPTAPHIPVGPIQSLIPRLTTTINDIDAFKTLLGQGATNGSMPNWETLLQRYSLLLGRINALSTYLVQPAPPPPVRTGVPRAPPDNRPALERYIVHPLNPLGASADPIAPEAFFQVINTQSLPAVSEAQAELLARREWKGKEELKRMGEGEIGSVLAGLRARLEGEAKTAEGLRLALEKHGEEYEWGMRVDGGDADADGEEKEDEEEDLFGEDEDGMDGGKASASKGAADGLVLAPNPREGWKIADYVRYMDTGVEPVVAS